MTRKDVPAWLVGEIARAMSKLPSERHGSALEFAEALRRGALGLSPRPPAPRHKPDRHAMVSPAPLVPTQTRSKIHVPGMPPEAWPVRHQDLIGRPPPPAVPTAAGTEAAPTAVGRNRKASPAHAAPEPPAAALAQPEAAPVAAEEPAAMRATTGAQTQQGTAEAQSSAPAETEQPRIPVRFEARPEPSWEALNESDLNTGIASDWLTPSEPWRTQPDKTFGRGFGTRRFDGLDLLHPIPGRRMIFLTVLLGVAVLAIAGAAVLLLTSRGTNNPGGEPTATAPSAAEPTKFISVQAAGAPTNIRISREGPTSVTLTWDDPTPGTVSFIVVGSGPGSEKLETKSVARGKTTVTYTQLDASKKYCFVIGAVYDINRVATAPEVCLTR
jgi:hypothetical protein